MPRVNISILKGSLGIFGRNFVQGDTATVDLDTQTYSALQAFEAAGVISIISEETSPVIGLPVNEAGVPFLPFENTPDAENNYVTWDIADGIFRYDRGMEESNTWNRLQL